MAALRRGAAALAVLLCAACATTLPVAAWDHDVSVTRQDFSAWLEPQGLRTVKETLSKRRLLGFHTLSYEYEGEGETLAAVLRCEIMILRDVENARHAYRSMLFGARRGADELAAEETTLDWAEESETDRMLVDGRQIGNLYVGRRGRIVVMVAIGGVYSSDSALFEAQIEPDLWRLTAYDPEAGPRPTDTARRPGFS